ncbi:MAG TPA: HTH domain-containing protein [Steroidobacteraceae bacterium]|nr:HTH domain-containing protein [Steroidobacteraceae bacterium]
MGLAQEILKRIKNKEAEVARLEAELQEIQSTIREARSYIQGLRDILPKAEKDDTGPDLGDFRPGTMPANVKAILEKEGKPLHINEIVQKLGRENTKQNRLSVVGTLARCVREKMSFTRPAPNTFGLISWKAETSEVVDDQIPDGFGK